MKLAEKISSLRKNKSISQESLAESSGISLRTIQRIENGESIPRPYTLKTIAQALEINVEELNFAEEEKLNPETDHEALNTLRLINSSTLIVLVLPLFNIIIPFIIWYKNKKNVMVNNIGKQIISFQILWSMACIFLLITTPVVHYKLTGSVMNGHVPPLLLVYLSMLLVNIICILFNSIKLKEEKLSVYPFIPSLF